MSVRGVTVPSKSLQVLPGVRVDPDARGHRKATGLSLMVEPIDSTDVIVKFATASCRMFPLAGEGQITDDGSLCWNLKDSVMGGPGGCVSGLVFSRPPSPMKLKFC